MKTDIIVTSEDRARLERLVGDRNTPAKIVWRAQIVLASADGNNNISPGAPRLVRFQLVASF